VTFGVTVMAIAVARFGTATDFAVPVSVRRHAIAVHWNRPGAKPIVRGFVYRHTGREVALFSTREIAVGVWLGVAVLWALRHKGVREGLRGVVGALLARQIVAVIGLAAVYSVGSIALLRWVGLWTPSLAKDSVLWFIVGGPFFAMSAVASRSGEFSGRKLARDAASATILVEYVASAYTFALPVELLLVPTLTTVALLSAVADAREEFIPARRFFGGIMAIAGLAVFAFSIRMAAADYASFANAATWRSITLAPLLSLLFLPFVYALALYSGYEGLFLRLRYAIREDEALRRYAVRRLIRSLGTKLAKVKAFQKSQLGGLTGARTADDVNRLITDFEAVQANGSATSTAR
jgi:hypothetical protein